MKILTDIIDINTVLSSYQGADIYIYMYNPSLARLMLRITDSLKKEELYITGISCIQITGKFKWKNIDLYIYDKLNNVTNEIHYFIIDEKAGFKLECSGGVSLAKGVSSEFGDNFESFLDSLK